MLKAEALEGPALVDNLILLRLRELCDIQEVLRDKYNMVFSSLKVDPTPAEYKEIANKHSVLIERGRAFVVYVPLGVTLDDALLQIDIPQYDIQYRFISNCNYRILKTGYPATMLSKNVADFRPLLIFRRLIMDCIELAATNLHFESVFVNKHPVHIIRYRIKKEMHESMFKIDRDMMQRVLQAVIGQLSPASVADLDSKQGITTSIHDVFHDGTCDIRVTGSRTRAGFDVDFTIQTTNTTTRTVDELGFPKEDVDLIRQIARRRTGLTLVTGEQRTGKNTTVFAMVNEIVNDPIRIVEYSSPIETLMPFPQHDYNNDVELLRDLIRKAKKQDIDIAILNEIPNAEVAFAVRDLVNSAIGVITTTHINRVWHLPNKLREFFGDDHKTIISQLNVVINHKMFRRWHGPGMQKRVLVKEHGDFELFCYANGVRQYFVPSDASKVKYEYQPLTEILVITDPMKTAMLNFDELWRAEDMLKRQVQQQHATLENKVAQYVNAGLMSLEEMRNLF